MNQLNLDTFESEITEELTKIVNDKTNNIRSISNEGLSTFEKLKTCCKEVKPHLVSLSNVINLEKSTDSLSKINTTLCEVSRELYDSKEYKLFTDSKQSSTSENFIFSKPSKDLKKALQIDSDMRDKYFQVQLCKQMVKHLQDKIEMLKKSE